jgi:two-component system, NtrC family, sensor kinase
VVRPLRPLPGMTLPTSRRVLVIDDMESIQRDFAKALAPAVANPLAELEEGLFGRKGPAVADEISFELSYASQGLEGVERVRQALLEGRPYALAFVDVRMPPGLDGIETVVHLWEADPQLEVVICTAYSDYSWRQMLERLARSAQFLVLSKPFDSTVVKQMALGLTEKWNLARAAERSSALLESLVVERTHQLSETNEKLKNEIHERTQLERLVRHSQRLEALGRLVGGVAHEINNPLTVVLTNLDHLKHELEDAADKVDARFRELVQVTEETQGGGRRIQQIVRDLRTFSQTEHQLVEGMNLRETMEYALRMAQASFPPSLKISTHYDEDLPSVRGSPAQLLQVFLNVVINAAQSGSSLPEDRRSVEVAIRQSASEKTVITVADHGVGIRPEDLSRIFDPFFTTRAVGTGTGLGLSVCHGFIKELGGEISVESRLGEGTVVTIVLPRQPPLLVAPQGSGVPSASALTPSAVSP